jgi:hypothetical protein
MCRSELFTPVKNEQGLSSLGSARKIISEIGETLDGYGPSGRQAACE